jgi:hypothetical protein
LAVPGALGAQSVRGQLTDSVTRSPLPGAFLTLVDEQGAEKARTITNGAGEFLLTAPAPGVYRLRSKRIGFRPHLSPALTLRAGETSGYNASVDPIPIALQQVVVAGDRQCDVESGASTAALWDEVREALAAVSWTSRVPSYWYELRMFQRELSASARRRGDDSTWSLSGYSLNPIRNVVPPAELEAQGFVVVTDTGWVYRAPDADVLLSASFLRTHCFETQAGRGETEGLIGLGFTSARGRSVPDVTGTLWVDRRTSELRQLQFRYIRLPEDVASPNAGGHVEFLRLPSGMWIVRDWAIRMPRSQMKQQPMGMGNRPEVVGFVETGGSVVTIKGSQTGTLVYRSDSAAALVAAAPPAAPPPPVATGPVPPPAPPAAVPGADTAASAPSGSPAPSRARRNPNLIERPEIDATTALDAYTLVQEARPTWLHSRGTISLTDPSAGAVQVYLNGEQFGDVNRLREIPISEIRQVRFLGAGEAQLRYGSGHAGGVIEVSTGAVVPTRAVAASPKPPPAPPPPPASDTTRPSPKRGTGIRDSEVLQADEFEGSTALDAMALVQEFRPNWLHPRGVISIRDPSAGIVKVYLNGVPTGDVSRLREIRADEVRELRHLGAAEAQQRYGLGHGGGVIEVWTK